MKGQSLSASVDQYCLLKFYPRFCFPKGQNPFTPRVVRQFLRKLLNSVISIICKWFSVLLIKEVAHKNNQREAHRLG